MTGTGKASGTVQFAGGAGTLTIRNKAGTGPVGTMTVGNHTGGGTEGAAGKLFLRGHAVDIVGTTLQFDGCDLPTSECQNARQTDSSLIRELLTSRHLIWPSGSSGNANATVVVAGGTLLA